MALEAWVNITTSVMIGYKPRGQPQGQKDEGSGVSRGGYQEAIVKSDDRKV